MARDRFYIYANTRPAIESLPPDKAVKLILALYDCAEGKEHKPLEDPTLEVFYRTFSPVMERDRDSYIKACEAKSAGRKRGWSDAFPEGEQ